MVDAEACYKALDCLESLLRDFGTSSLKDDHKLKAFLDNAESIIKRDLHDFEMNNT